MSYWRRILLCRQRLAREKHRGIEIIGGAIANEHRGICFIVDIAVYAAEEMFSSSEHCETGAATYSARCRLQDPGTGVKGGFATGTLSDVKSHTNSTLSWKSLSDNDCRGITLPCLLELPVRIACSNYRLRIYDGR